MIEEIYDSVRNDINYTACENIPELKKYIDILKTMGYNSKWHTEDNVWEHTKNTVAQMKIRLDKDPSYNRYEKKIGILSAFFHDFGKAETGKKKENGDWSFPMHADVGGHLVRRILWDDDITTRENICFIIKYHMHHISFQKGNLSLSDAILIANGNITHKLFIDLAISDILGSDRTFIEDYETYIHSFEEYLNLFKNKFMTQRERFNFFIGKKNESYEHEPINNFTVYLMCGISGSGKSTYITSYLNELEIISRDKFREWMGITHGGLKGIGTKEQEEEITIKEHDMIERLCKSNTSFVVDDMFLKRKYREELEKTVFKYHGNVTIIYLETKFSENIKRRMNNVSEDILDGMIKKIDFPTINECTELKIIST